MRACRRRIPHGYLRAAALVLACGSATAQDLRVGAGIDILHKQNMPVVALKYRAAMALAWDNKNFGAGLTYDLGEPQGWSAGLGGMLAGRTDEDLGTHLNALLRLSYCGCGASLCLTGVHVSHGSSLGLAAGKANSGLNFLLLELRR